MSTEARWLSRIDKDSKEARNKKIFELWLACHTQEEIAERCECPRTTVETVLTEMAILPESSKPYADHLVDFDVPLYWKRIINDPRRFYKNVSGLKKLG